MRAPPALGNPRRLLRILECVFGGIRRPASIARIVDSEVRVVRSYLGHAEFCGLLRAGPEPQLSALGLEFVMFSRARADVLARAIAAHPVLSVSLDVETLIPALLAANEASTPALARRDARAIARLLAGARTARSAAGEAQLSLAFPGPIPVTGRSAGAEASDDSLDVYAIVLRGLLEHGELSLATLRGLLDASGAENAGLGGYAALAVRRKDATRRGEHLVVTAGAIQRAELAESAVSIAISDPDFRVWLESGDGAAGEEARCQKWGRRLFGNQPKAEALPRLLFGRRLATFPLAGEAGPTVPAAAGPFADCAAAGSAALAFPRAVAELEGGLSWVHARWRSAVLNAGSARAPSVLDARVAVYGGLFSPGETPPRNIPDLLTLRMRAVRNVPALALLAVAGELHRRKAMRLRERGDDVWVEFPGREPRTMGEWLGTVAKRRNWLVSAAPGRSVWPGIARAAITLGVLTKIRDVWTIDEVFYTRLGSDPEHHELHEHLAAVRDAVDDASRGGG